MYTYYTYMIFMCIYIYHIYLYSKVYTSRDVQVAQNSKVQVNVHGHHALLHEGSYQIAMEHPNLACFQTLHKGLVTFLHCNYKTIGGKP